MRHPSILRSVCALLPALVALPACAQTATQNTTIDVEALARDVAVLAADSMEGRGAGTEGGARARRYLLRRFLEVGLQPAGEDFELPFPLRADSGESSSSTGINIAGVVRGNTEPDRWIVVSAHYDHLGTRNGQVFNGADDNASGVAGLLALADWFADNPHGLSVMFVAFDAEERGLLGARAFVESPPIPRTSIALNVNLDMIGRNDAGELYIAGTSHYPALEPLVDSIAADAPVRLLKGHDRPSARASDDWTLASDHGPFHQAGIPFLYFGVEDHPDYHRPTDDTPRIQPDFHARAVSTVLSVIRAFSPPPP